MLIVAIIFIVIALILYSLAIWSEQIKGVLKPWMIKTFGSAFSCDLAGTSLMFWRAPVKFEMALHSLCGYGALVIMGLHLVWALWAWQHPGRASRYFHRFSIVAWIVWLAAFISGLPKA